MAERKKSIAVGVGLFAMLVYLPALRFELLSWDDAWYVTHNPLIRGLGPAHLKAMFTEAFSANFLPLHLLSYAVDYAIWGGDSSFGFHLTSLFINGFSASLAFLLLIRLRAGLPVALAGALLFAIHHGHVSSVAWVSSRKGVLALFFVFGCALAYLRAQEAPGRTDWRWYSLALLLYGCSVMSKLTMVLLPVFLFAHSWLGGWRPLGRLLALQLPFAILAVIMSLLNTTAQVTSTREYGLGEFLCMKGDAICRYAAVLLGFSTGQPVYSHPEALSGLMLLPVLAIPLLLIWLWRRQQFTGLLGSIWMVVMLLPALAFPLVTYMADRYLYATSFGFCWLLAAGLWRAAERLSPQKPIAVFAALVALPMLIFAGRFAQYLPVWRDSETLMRVANARCDDFRVREHLASALMVRGAYGEAESVLAADVEAGRYASTRILAHCHYLQQDFVGAEPLYTRCVEHLRQGSGALVDTLERTGSRRRGADVLRNYGHILLEGENPRPAALIALLAPFAEEMADARLSFYLGAAYYRQKQPELAVTTLGKALAYGKAERQTATWLANCGFSLGASHWSLGQRDRARECWRDALQLDPKNASIQSWLEK
jgi:tetratricopeptide (TPR) repeat protein